MEQSIFYQKQPISEEDSHSSERQSVRNNPDFDVSCAGDLLELSAAGCQFLKKQLMIADRLQLQRFELKYIIPETMALAIRDFASAYLVLDEHGAGFPQSAYPIHSLYLDSGKLSLYGSTINGEKNRFKLRLRFYQDQAEAPVYFEIKRRVNDAILKQRVAVRRAAVSNFLNGLLPEDSSLIQPDSGGMVTLQRFHELMTRIHAKPMAHVAYRREAWIEPDDNSVRVTLDRDVRFEPETSGRLEMRMKAPLAVFDRKVVLEIKFTGRFPDWIGELVRAFDLTRCSAAKYAGGVTLLGEERMAALAFGCPFGTNQPGPMEN